MPICVMRLLRGCRPVWRPPRPRDRGPLAMNTESHIMPLVCTLVGVCYPTSDFGLLALWNGQDTLQTINAADITCRKEGVTPYQ